MNPKETKKQLLQTIRAEATKRWGEEKWVLNLTKEYCKILHANGELEAKVPNLRRSVERSIVDGTCSLENLIALAHCVGCRIQMTREEILVA
jgi:hypothetical protein